MIVRRFVPLLSAVVLLLPGVAVAQVERGDLEVSFSASLGRDDLEGTTTIVDLTGVTTSDSWGFGLNTTAGYFVSDHVSVGGFIGFSYYDSDSSSQSTMGGVPLPPTSTTSENRSYSIGPLFNYHFRPSSKIVPFAGISGGWFRGESESRSTGGAGSFAQHESEEDGWTLGVAGGADFFLNPHVSLKLQLRHVRFDTDAESSSPSRGVPMSVIATRTRETESTDILVGIAVFLDTKRR